MAINTSCYLPFISPDTCFNFQTSMVCLQIAVFFNVEAEVEEPKFEMTVKLVEDTINLLRLETCAR